MNNAFFGKTLENGRNHRDIKLIATETRGNYLVLDVEIKLSCNKIISQQSDNLLAIEMKITHILMNEAVYLGLSILEKSKIVMYEYWYDYAKPKYRKK